MDGRPLALCRYRLNRLLYEVILVQALLSYFDCLVNFITLMHLFFLTIVGVLTNGSKSIDLARSIPATETQCYRSWNGTDSDMHH